MNNNPVSLIGQNAVLSKLKLLEYDAKIIPWQARSKCILISIPANPKKYRIEVKTNYHDSHNNPQVDKLFGKIWNSWRMNEKHEKIVDSDLFYCFVSIEKQTNNKKYFIVPSKIVAKYIKEQHKYWLDESRKLGKNPKDTAVSLIRIGLKGEKYPISVSTPTVEQYENNWDFKETNDEDIVLAIVNDDLESIKSEETFEEGGKIEKLINYYERDPKIRVAAINIHGTCCQVCGFDFSKKYGSHGQGFVEVHHNKPIKSLKEKTRIDPNKDINVLCSNCHRMVHRKRNKVLSIDELKVIIK